MEIKLTLEQEDQYKRLLHFEGEIIAENYKQMILRRSPKPMEGDFRLCALRGCENKMWRINYETQKAFKNAKYCCWSCASKGKTKFKGKIIIA